jgi:tetrahydrodipicolinate N-succinyltransferase
MGYISDVRALVYAKNRNDADQYMQYMQLKLLVGTTFKDVFEEWSSYFRWVDNERVLDFQADDVKWYESYEDVQNIERFLREVEELEYVVEFIRVGEESEDIETRYSDGSECLLGTSTSISCYL